MVTGKRCFYGKTNKEIFKKIKRGEWKWPSSYTPSKLIKSFVEV